MGILILLVGIFGAIAGGVYFLSFVLARLSPVVTIAIGAVLLAVALYYVVRQEHAGARSSPK